MKKRLQKKLTKLFLSNLICGSLDNPYRVAWSAAWRGYMSVGDLRSIKRMFRRRCCRAAYKADLSGIERGEIEGEVVRFAGPGHPIPAYKLSPQTLLRCA